MSEAAKALGKGGYVSWQGQHLELTPLNFDMISELEVTLQTRAWDAAEAGKDRCEPEVYQSRLRAVADQIAAGAYGWGSPAMANYTATRAGQQELLYLMLKPRNPRVTRDDVGRMFREVLEQVLARMAEANRNPDPLGVPGTAEAPPSA